MCTSFLFERWLPSKQDDSRNEHERCQDGCCQSPQFRHAPFGTQLQNALSPQGIGREPKCEERTACRPMTQDRSQHQQSHDPCERRLQELCGETTRPHALVGGPYPEAGCGWWPSTAASQKASHPTHRHSEQQPRSCHVEKDTDWQMRHREQKCSG